jgi:hypothetical protein
MQSPKSKDNGNGSTPVQFTLPASPAKGGMHSFADNRAETAGIKQQQQIINSQFSQPPVQRIVYFNKENAGPMHNQVKGLDTKKKYEELTKTKLGTKDEDHLFIKSAKDPRFNLLVEQLVIYVHSNFEILDEDEVHNFCIDFLAIHAEEQEVEYALGNILPNLVEQLLTNKYIGEKELPKLDKNQDEKYSEFISRLYDTTEKTPEKQINTKKEDVLSSFTKQGQQVNSFIFINKTPIGIFHNKHRDKRLVKLHEEGFKVPDLKIHDNAHTHSEDEAIYELLYGELKGKVPEFKKSKETYVITFMISDLTCHYNQIQSKKQRNVRSCCQNIILFRNKMHKLGKEVEVQVIYGRPYNLDHYGKKDERSPLGDKAKEALDIFFENGIRVRALSSFFSSGKTDTNVLAKPLAYGIEEPGSPKGFDASETPFPNFGKKKLEEEKKESSDSEKESNLKKRERRKSPPKYNKKQKIKTKDKKGTLKSGNLEESSLYDSYSFDYGDGVIVLDGERLFDNFVPSGKIQQLDAYQCGRLAELMERNPKCNYVGLGGGVYKIHTSQKKGTSTSYNPSGAILGLSLTLRGG